MFEKDIWLWICQTWFLIFIGNQILNFKPFSRTQRPIAPCEKDFLLFSCIFCFPLWEFLLLLFSLLMCRRIFCHYNSLQWSSSNLKTHGVLESWEIVFYYFCDNCVPLLFSVSLFSGIPKNWVLKLKTDTLYFESFFFLLYFLHLCTFYFLGETFYLLVLKSSTLAPYARMRRALLWSIIKFSLK